MKKIILVMVIAMVASLTYAQEKMQERDVPGAVISEFQKRHPGVKNAMWEKDRNQYRATFNQDGSRYVVEINERGNDHRTKITLKEHEVPTNVSAYATKNYPEEKYKEVDKIIDRDGKVSYSMKIKDQEHYFDDRGNFVKDKEKVHIKETDKKVK